MFDLNGYLVFRNACAAAPLAAQNDAFDNFLPPRQGEWWSNAQRRNYVGETGFELYYCDVLGAHGAASPSHPPA